MYSGETVTLVNRTCSCKDMQHDAKNAKCKGRVLFVRWDGKERRILPGANHGFPVEMIRFAITQNPVMGTEDLYRPKRFKSLVGVQGKDDCTTLQQDPKAVERFDRKTTKGQARKAVRIEGDHISPSEARVADIEEGGEGVIDGATYANQ